MSVPFGRTLRAVDTDGLVRPLIASAVAAVFVIAWGVWLTKASITLVEVSRRADIEAIVLQGPTPSLGVVAEFAATALGRLRIGETARFSVDGFPPTQWGTVSARIVRITPQRGHGAQAELLFDGTQTRIPLQEGLSGSVAVEVERTSPLRLVLSAVSGAFTGAPAQMESR